MSPTQRTYAWLRGLGIEPEPCTWFVKFPGMRMGVRKDICGCLDCLALLPPCSAIDISPERRLDPSENWGKVGRQIVGPCILGLQITDDSDHAKRREKILASARAHRWLAAGGRIAVVSWGLRVWTDGRKRWTPRVEEICPR